MFLDKNRYKPRICFPSLRLAFHSTKSLREQILDCFTLSECKAVARCATRKTETAINRIKIVGTCETVYWKIHMVMDIRNRWGS